MCDYLTNGKKTEIFNPISSFHPLCENTMKIFFTFFYDLIVEKFVKLKRIIQPIKKFVMNKEHQDLTETRYRLKHQQQLEKLPWDLKKHRSGFLKIINFSKNTKLILIQFQEPKLNQKKQEKLNLLFTSQKYILL
jgi:hypothetical protein